MGGTCLDGAARLHFLESEIAERLKDFRTLLGALCSSEQAVFRAVGVPEHEPARRTARDRELALVNRAMVRSAEHDQAFWIVGPPSARGSMWWTSTNTHDLQPGTAQVAECRRITARRTAGAIACVAR